jgi:CBS domain-containing protein
MSSLEGCVDTYTAKDIMSRSVVAVRPGATVREAARLMKENNVGSVLVLGEKGEPLGILTERDMVRILADGVDPGSPVEEHMTPNPITVGPDEPVLSIFCIMVKNNIRHVPVVDGEGRVVGIVSIRDIVRLEAGDVEAICGSS